MLLHISGGIFCRACGGEGSTILERESGVRGGLWINWGDDDADDKATVWHSEGYGDGQCLLCDEGADRDVSSWGVWEYGDQKTILAQVLKWICHLGILTRQRGCGMFVVVVVICMGTSTRYSVLRRLTMP